MTSKLVVNTIEADTGISSVSFASSISMSSTSKFHFSAAGIDIGADTNINRPAAGVLGFNINGSEKIRITSSGHLGLGDNNPDTRLSVTAASGTDVVGKFTSTDANAWIQFRDNSTTDTGVMVGASGDNLLLRAGSNERVRVDSTGRLLVGAGAIANPKSSGAGSIDLDNQAFSIMVGGNHPSGGRSNNNAKTFRMSMVHYALAEEPINILQGYCDSSDNNVYIGGGTGSANSLTSVRIYTGANTTTTGGTERFRIHSAGQIGLSGANYGSAGQVLTSQGSGSAVQWASVASGGASNISFNSGYGIDFSADSHQSGMTSELLDDYEEGTWPGAINIGTATISQTNYVKIGRFVNATCFCAQMSPRNSGSGIQITGLPYAANGTYTAPIGLHRVIGDQGNGYFAYVSSGTTTIDILQNPWSQQGWKSLAHNQIQHASAAYIIIAVSYQTS